MYHLLILIGRGFCNTLQSKGIVIGYAVVAQVQKFRDLSNTLGVYDRGTPEANTEDIPEFRYFGWSPLSLKLFSYAFFD